MCGSESSDPILSSRPCREPPSPLVVRPRPDAAAALSWDIPPRVHTPPLHLPPSAVWSISRRQRNRLQHALNGNPSTPDTGWQTAGRRRGDRVPGAEVRQLSELQPVSRLRQDGWEIPPSVMDSSLLRVYDLRLDH